MLKATDQEIEDVREYPERNEADEGADSSSPPTRMVPDQARPRH